MVIKFKCIAFPQFIKALLDHARERAEPACPRWVGSSRTPANTGVRGVGVSKPCGPVSSRDIMFLVSDLLES